MVRFFISEKEKKNMFDDFDSRDLDEATVRHFEHCDAEMFSAIALLELGDTIAARHHIFKGLSIFANHIARQVPPDLDINEVAHEIVISMLAGGLGSVDPIIDEMENQFS